MAEDISKLPSDICNADSEAEIDESMSLPVLLCCSGHPVEKLKVHLKRHQGLMNARRCNICSAPIHRHESHWRCTHHCDYNVCSTCFWAHWRSSLVGASEFDTPRGTRQASLLRAAPPQLRGCGLYASIAERWHLDVPHAMGAVIHRVRNVPGYASESHLSVCVEIVDDQLACFAKAQTHVVTSSQVAVWDRVLSFPSDEPSSRGAPSWQGSPEGSQDSSTSWGSVDDSCSDTPPLEKWVVEKTSVRFTLYEIRTVRSMRSLGSCLVPLGDLLRKPFSSWMLFDSLGDAALCAVPPHLPCELDVSVVEESIPRCWPSVAVPRADDDRAYPKHAFVMTRGTRGDVQPFIALARGLAEQQGWMVTICTEWRWKSLVEAHNDVTHGCICFRCSGGDTEAHLHSAGAQLLLRSKSDVLQMVCLSHSEELCFPSAPVFVHHVQEMEQSGHPVDVVIFGLTVISLALLVSERCRKPLLGFILQPSIIPSRDETWSAVAPLGKIIGNSLTSHETLRVMKELVEHNPLARWSIGALRRAFGLGPLDTWEALRKHNIPLIIPMQAGTFSRPSDWWDSIELTDFIFLSAQSKTRSSPPSIGALPGDEAAGVQVVNGIAVNAIATRDGSAVDGWRRTLHLALGSDLACFLSNAREHRARVCLVTFSSMPVSRRVVLQCITKMVEECRFDLRLIYVGRREDGPVELEARASDLAAQGRFLEMERTDFGMLFPEVDCFVVHGGLGTTVEALRSRKPVCVTGPLLLDQRFWGMVCFQQGVGPEPIHIDSFRNSCVDFVNDAVDPLDPRGWRQRARTLKWSSGGVDGDGVTVNVDRVASLVRNGLRPVQAQT